MQVIRLAAGALRAEVAPSVGGSLSGFWSVEAGAARLDWLRPADHEALARRDPLAMASFPLVPFCNRIRGGRAHFEGREVRFPPNDPGQPSPHPLHGVGWRRAWAVRSQSDEAVELALEVAACEAWPWHFSASQRIALESGALTVTLTVLNEDAVPMPLGLGHHPYFPRRAGTRLTAACTGIWRTDAQVMPTRLETGDPIDRLRAGVPLDELVLDNNFVGWDRQARIDWPADALGPARHLVMRAEAGLDFFVVYSPPGADYFCAEPVSQCTDWLNLMAQHGPDELGGARVLPGECLTGRFSLTPGLGG